MESKQNTNEKLQCIWCPLAKNVQWYAVIVGESGQLWSVKNKEFIPRHTFSEALAVRNYVVAVVWVDVVAVVALAAADDNETGF
jgi:hypothetical protein